MADDGMDWRSGSTAHQVGVAPWLLGHQFATLVAIMLLARFGVVPPEHPPLLQWLSLHAGMAFAGILAAVNYSSAATSEYKGNLGWIYAGIHLALAGANAYEAWKIGSLLANESWSKLFA